MSDIKICDKCKKIFPERQEGSSKITAGIVFRGDFNTNLQGDFCPSCTSEITAKVVQTAINPPDQESPEDEKYGFGSSYGYDER